VAVTVKRKCATLLVASASSKLPHVNVTVF